MVYLGEFPDLFLDSHIGVEIDIEVFRLRVSRLSYLIWANTLSILGNSGASLPGVLLGANRVSTREPKHSGLRVWSIINDISVLIAKWLAITHYVLFGTP